jgi:glycosyltransferase involved in cell wall biosynthesis
VESPFVTVVVPTRNRAVLLHDCLASLLAQDYAPDRHEIIVVDDGSSDSTSEVVRSGGARASVPVRYVVSPGRGLNAARNAGIHAAGGELIAFVDDDVEAPRFWLREIAAGSLRHPGASCLGGRIRLRLEGKAPKLCGREPLGETELDLGDLDIPVRAVWGANMVVRRSALEKVGLFCEQLPLYGDEEEWQSRLRSSGGTIFYLPEAWLWHRRTSEQLVLWRLLRARFLRGRGQAALRGSTGRPFNSMSQLSSIPRLLAHAIVRRCAWGLLAASTGAGYIWEVVSRWGWGRTRNGGTASGVAETRS